MRFGAESCLLRVLLSACFVAAAFGGASAEQPALSTKRGPATVTIVAGKQPVLLYRFGDAPFKPYIKELFTPAGVQVLRDSPHDHVHHRGVMYALVADGVDFWGERSQCGKERHAKLTIQPPARRDGVWMTGLKQQLRWTPPDADQPLLLEHRTIEAYRGEDLKATLLMWRTRLEPGEGRTSVKITGTHYDGLGTRFVQSMDRAGRFLYACGEPGPIVRGTERVTATKWCAYTAEADDKAVTVALFDYPQNPRQPAGMFTMQRPFAYLSATPNVWKQPLELKQGTALEFRYGIALWDRTVGRQAIEGLYEKWLKWQQQENQR